LSESQDANVKGECPEQQTRKQQLKLQKRIAAMNAPALAAKSRLINRNSITQKLELAARPQLQRQ